MHSPDGEGTSVKKSMFLISKYFKLGVIITISAIEPITAGINEFWSGDSVSINVM
jgi:hypothetical protein